jgi:acyl carrier protein
MADTLSPQVMSVIARTQYIPLESISSESTFEELGIDSLNGLSIVSALEKEFGVDIPNEDALLIRDIPQLVRCLESILPEAGVAVHDSVNEGQAV